MNNGMLDNVAILSKKHRRKKIWLRILAFMCAVVVFVTTYALILPGITKERPVFCGFEEHTHTEECYKKVIYKEIICTPELHSHTEECVSGEGEVLCREADYFIHKHNELCYDDNGELICPIPEVEEHSHTEECYTVAEEDEAQEPELTCTKPPLELHSHEDECYNILETEEGEVKECICEKIVLTEHVHTAECVNTIEENELFCTLEEHTHNDDCYIDLSSDLETPSVWEATIPKELSGVWTEDILSVAQSQLGYSESASNIIKDENGNKYGYTRYGEWYGEPYREWSELFVMFCLEYAGVEEEYFPVSADSAEWLAILSKNDLVINSDPKIGDIIFFDDELGIICEAVTDEQGIVTSVKIVCKNEGGTVAYRDIILSTIDFKGYGDLNKAYRKYAETKPVEQIYSDGNVTVKASYPEFADIPEGAVLSVTSISRGKRFEDRYNEAFWAIDSANGQIKEPEITDFYLYDICFIHNDTEIQPSSSVDIEITLNDTKAEENSEISVVHFAKEGTELPELSKTELNESKLNVEFSVESFSEFAIVTSRDTEISLVSMVRFTAETFSSTDKYAIVSNNKALLAQIKDGTPVLTSVDVLEHDIDDDATIDQRAQQWIIAPRSAGSNYYRISAEIDSTAYYLVLSGNDLSFTTDAGSATSFQRYWTDGVLRLYSGNAYITPAESDFISNTAADLTLYQASTSSHLVIFDAAIGYPQYMSSNNHKYEGAEYWEKTVTTGKVVLPHNDPDSSDTANYIRINDEGASDTNSLNNWYKLNGWYDVVNQVFYDSSMLGKEISVTNDTIFYPEYVSANYDQGVDNGKVIADQPDTSDFINTYMFDYNEIFNVDKSICTDFYYSSTEGRYVTEWRVDTTDDVAMVFFDYLTDWNNPYGNIGYMLDRNGVEINGISINEEKTAGVRGDNVTFPGTITKGIVGEFGASNVNNTRLDSLFTHETIPGRVYLGEADWFYNYDEGFYYYNSAANAAAYNQSEQRFYVYDYKVRIDNNGSHNDFTPFTYRDAEAGGEVYAKEKDNEINYWVGMQSEIEFYLPEDSGSAGNVSSYGDDLQFRFSGDDDVWIFVDGQLVVDLGGVHDVVYGEINFATGKIRTGDGVGTVIADNVASSFSEMPGLADGATEGVNEYDLPQLEGGQYHTVTVYYLERGSALSNCAIYFNISPFYELELKKVDPYGNVLAGAEFTVYEDEACTQIAELYTRDENGSLVSVPAVFTTDENGLAFCEGLYAGVTYYIKETKPPPGYPDMSVHIIVANLAEPGKSVTVTATSDGKEWIFADAYVFSKEHEHRIEINIYNDKHTGGEKQLYVEKQWADGSTNIPDEVILRLYANGEPTSRTISLNSTNGWQTTIYQLPEFDENGNAYVYTVVEESGGKFTPAYYELIQEEATSITSGETYWIVSANGKALSLSSSNTIVQETPSATSKAQQWTFTTNGSGYTIRNVGTPSRYLRVSNSGVTSNTSSTAIRYSSNKLYYSSWRSSYYVYESGTGYAVSTSQNTGTSFSLMKYSSRELDTSITATPESIRVVNTPWPDTVSIPLIKQWDATVSTLPSDVTFGLYLVTEGEESTPTLIRELTLNEANGWAGSFDELDYPEAGSYYAIIENTDDYSVTYHTEKTSKVYAYGKYREGARVEFDQNGEAIEVGITNSALLVLPNTGGISPNVYTIGGIVLIVSSAVLLLYKKRRRRQEEFFSP